MLDLGRAPPLGLPQPSPLVSLLSPGNYVMTRGEASREMESWEAVRRLVTGTGRLMSDTTAQLVPDGGEPVSTAWLGWNRMGCRQAL